MQPAPIRSTSLRTQESPSAKFPRLLSFLFHFLPGCRHMVHDFRFRTRRVENGVKTCCVDGWRRICSDFPLSCCRFQDVRMCRLCFSLVRLAFEKELIFWYILSTQYIFLIIQYQIYLIRETFHESKTEQEGNTWYIWYTNYIPWTISFCDEFSVARLYFNINCSSLKGNLWFQLLISIV